MCYIRHRVGKAKGYRILRNVWTLSEHVIHSGAGFLDLFDVLFSEIKLFIRLSCWMIIWLHNWIEIALHSPMNLKSNYVIWMTCILVWLWILLICYDLNLELKVIVIVSVITNEFCHCWLVNRSEYVLRISEVWIQTWILRFLKL